MFLDWFLNACVVSLSWSSEMWIALGADSTVARQIMEMIMEKLNAIVPYVDKKESILKPGMTKVATNQPLAVSDTFCMFGSTR